MPVVRRVLSSRISAIAVLILLLAFWTQALAVASATSMTIDEGLHLASGYTIWRTGDYRLIEEHPPLVKLWLALPLLPLDNIGDPTLLPAWAAAAEPTTESLPLLHMAQQLLYPVRPVERWLFAARTMSALLGILLLAVVCRWSREAIGPVGSLVTVGLASFDPNLLAHAAVAGTDLGAAAFITLGLWRGTRFLQSPSRRAAFETGAALGLALATKLTAMLLGPALLVAGLIRLVRLPAEQRGRLVRLALVIVAVAGAVLWASYGLQVGTLPGTSLPVPAAAHAIPMMRILSHSRGGHQAFLLGQNSTAGWWYYFPVAFLLKTPLAALMAIASGVAMAVARLWRARPRRRWFTLASPPVLFVAVYTAASLLSSLNIGYRHLLPLLPVLYITTGHMAEELRRAKSAIHTAQALTILALLVTQATVTGVQAPHLLAFFNVAVGGAGEGWRYLADSNTDWGQAYRALAAYQADHVIDEVALAAFIFYDPAIYGVTYSPLPPLGGDTPAIFPSRLAPAAGDYAISATPLDGIPTADEAMYDWFRWREPDAQVGDVLFIHHVTEEERETRWVAQCITPTVPLGDPAMAAGFGDMPERAVTFDCTRAWLYPAAELGQGAYVLHGALVQDSLAARLRFRAPSGMDTFVDDHLARTEIAYWQRAYRDVPSFTVFRSEPSPVPASGWLMIDGMRAPVNLDGPLTFLGARRHSDERTSEIETWWRVTEQPGGRPFSIMGHWVTRDGTVLSVSDGLGVTPTGLLPGDVVVQRHTSAAAESQHPTRFLTGAYWLDSLIRWQLQAAASGEIPVGADTIPVVIEGAP